MVRISGDIQDFMSTYQNTRIRFRRTAGLALCIALSWTWDGCASPQCSYGSRIPVGLSVTQNFISPAPQPGSGHPAKGPCNWRTSLEIYTSYIFCSRQSNTIFLTDLIQLSLCRLIHACVVSQRLRILGIGFMGYHVFIYILVTHTHTPVPTHIHTYIHTHTTHKIRWG